MATSPTQRTLKYYRDQGHLAWVVERFIQRPGGFGFRSDLFKIIDLIVLDKERGIVGVQSTGQDFAGHKRTLLEEQAFYSRAWIEAGGTLELMGWRRVKKVRGGKAMVWSPRILTITLDMLPDPADIENQSE